MRQPVWILNTSILFFFLVLIAIISFYKVNLQSPYQIIPAEIPSAISQQKPSSLDLSKIYGTNDLFNTYKAEEVPAQQPEGIQSVPLPPQPILVQAPKIEVPQFLDPLPITLTGIFMFNVDAENRAIILDNKTKQETTYKIGDEVEDAQLVKIFSNKILLIRSNGQQELLYVRQEDATIDTAEHEKKNWTNVVKKIAQDTYLIDKQEFAFEVKSLSNAIDLFDLTTAYKQGKSIGSKIGRIEPESLATACGFVSGDIITMIEDIPAINTENRLQLYKKITTLPEENQITLQLLRKDALITLAFKIGTIKPIPPQSSIFKTTPETKAKLIKQYDKELRQEKIKLLKQKEKFAPTTQELRLYEKENILKHQKNIITKKDSTNKDMR